MVLDIPNIKFINIPHSFKKVESKSITSIALRWLFIGIDVDPVFANLVKIVD